MRQRVGEGTGSTSGEGGGVKPIGRGGREGCVCVGGGVPLAVLYYPVTHTHVCRAVYVGLSAVLPPSNTHEAEEELGHGGEGGGGGGGWKAGADGSVCWSVSCAYFVSSTRIVCPVRQGVQLHGTPTLDLPHWTGEVPNARAVQQQQQESTADVSVPMPMPMPIPVYVCLSV